MQKLTEYSIIGIIVILAVAAFSGAAPLVASQSTSTACTAQLTYSFNTALIIPGNEFVNQNIGLSVPVTVTCPFSNTSSTSLLAVGSAVDSSTSLNLGSVSAVLPYSTSNTNYYGRLTFSLPPSVLGHALQISVTVYGGGQYGPINLNGQYNGSQLAVQTETVQVNPSNYSSNWNPYYNVPSCYNGENCYNANQSPYGCFQSTYCNYANQPVSQCQVTTSGSNNTTTCSGYIYLGHHGCTELVIPINGPYSQQVYQYYTLTNMPSSSAHHSGAWVTVSGQLSVNQSGAQGYPNGADCPINSISVSSISP
ncbi:MAG TPA: hypothetical protein VE862_02945 [Candidatus Acidoferrum sp.]|nr:hypothetical protein [Candidatus Acidoferrum sp.]